MIQLKDVTKYYGTIGLGLLDVNLEIAPGQIVGILGENGAGKSSLLKCIMGLTDLYRGSILIDGKSPDLVYDQMAFITEEGSYFPYLTPIEYGKFLNTFFSNFDKHRYYKLLNFFELNSSKKIKTFSKGQRAKLEVCAGFSKGAKYILMDEPFLGKDLLTRRDFLKLLVNELQEDETILIATHLLDDIEHILDRAIILKNGRLKANLLLDDIHSQNKSLTDIMVEVLNYDATSRITTFLEN